MSWLYLREVVGVSSEASLADSEPSAQSNGTPTAKPSFWPVKLTASWNTSRYGTTCEPSKEPIGVERSMSLPLVFLASLSVLPANEKAKATTETDGLTPSESYGRWDQDTHCWKTSQACLIGMEDVTSEKYLESFPKAGLMQDGRLYQRPKLEPRIGAIGSGLWLTPMLPGNGGTNGKAKLKRMLNFPTPRAQDGPHGPARGSLGDVVRWPTPTSAPEAPNSNSNRKIGPNSLAECARLGSPIWPTPTNRDYRSSMKLTTIDRWQVESSRGVNLSEQMQRVERNGGQLNPPWVEWLMGWPIGWTDLKPLGMDRWQEWRQAHGGY